MRYSEFILKYVSNIKQEFLISVCLSDAQSWSNYPITVPKPHKFDGKRTMS